ncbi:MAG: LicD family protein, partial [Oscillospiraceae bacterium]|nr:LicD family protein [Oscillospiraceae bacterium]
DQYDDVISGKNEYSLFYHLSSLRSALLCWYPFRPDWRVLEIGAGFGALTGSLAAHTAQVDALERDPVRTQALRTRFADEPRIRVFEEDALAYLERTRDAYDCIVTVDVLEELGDRCGALLESCASHLRPGGVLLAGYRNRFGLRYLCGGADELCADPFDNLSDGRSRLLTRSAVDALMEQAGLVPGQYFYPLPGQDFAQAIYTDSAEALDSVRDRVFPFEPQLRTRIADEGALYDTVLHAGLLPQLANYYLAPFYRKGDAAPVQRRVQWVALSADRGRERGFATVCYEDDLVEKKALFPEGVPALRRAYETLQTLAARGIAAVPQELENGVIRMQKMRELPLLAYIRSQMAFGPDAVIRVFDRLREDVLRSSEPGELTERDCWINWGLDPRQAGPVLACGMIDMIPYNAFWADDEIRYYDQEFSVRDCPLGYILFRALRYTWIHLPELEQILPLCEMQEYFGLSGCWEAYLRREERFLDETRCRKRFAQVYNWQWTAHSPEWIEQNRNALLNADPQAHALKTLPAIHRVQLGLLKEFDRACRELGLPYFAIHGTLLGAVRHGGFIPWDDDVDVAMLREDYDKLLAKAGEVFHPPFFLQTPENTYSSFYGGYAKLRNSETAALEPQNRGKKCDQGIWIDILPLDNCPRDDRDRRRLLRRIRRWQRFLYAKLYAPETGVLKDVDPKKLSFYYLAAACMRRRWIVKRLEKLFRRCGHTGTAAILACYYGNRPMHNLYSLASLLPLSEKPFEDLSIPVPADCDAVLSARYGSHYMELPPADSRYRHSQVVFSTERSWRTMV